MATLKFIFTNPLGWGIAIVHWLVVVFAYLGDKPADPFGVHNTTELLYYLALLNLPSLIMAKFLISLFDPSTYIGTPGLLLIVSLITLQWLLIGAGALGIYREFRNEVPVDGENGLKIR